MNIRRILGIYCWLTKHKRGKPLGTPYMTDAGLFQQFACPRCGRTTRYKVKPALDYQPTQPTEGL